LEIIEREAVQRQVGHVKMSYMLYCVSMSLSG